MTNLKKSNCDQSQKLRFWQNSVVTVITVVTVVTVVTVGTVVTKNSVVFIYIFFFGLKLWQNLKNQIVTKLKNSNFDKTQKHKLGHNSKTQIVIKLKNSNFEKKNSKLYLRWNSKTQIVEKL